MGERSAAKCRYAGVLRSQRSAKANFAPSATESAREGASHPCQHARAGYDVVADRGGEQAIADENYESHGHERPAQDQHLQQRARLVGGDELGKERHENMDSFGVEKIDRDCGRDDLAVRTRSRLSLHLQRAVFAQSAPGHEPEIGDAEILERLKDHGALV